MTQAPLLSHLDASYSGPPLPSKPVAVRALASHLEQAVRDARAQAQPALLAAACSCTEQGSQVGVATSSSAANSTRRLEQTVASLLEPLFVHAAAWAVGGRAQADEHAALRVDECVRSAVPESCVLSPHFERV